MDLLFKRYASPFSLLDLMIQSNRFSEFIDEIMEAHNDDKLWQMYLGVLSNPMFKNDISFIDFKKSMLDPKSSNEQKPTDKDIEATIKKSKEILKDFKPHGNGGES